MDVRTSQFEALRPRLFAMAYRTLGSAADAEDVVQDAFLRWRNATCQPGEDIQSPQAYLMTIVSRLALDALGSARRRREQYVGMWLPEPLGASQAAADPVELAESVSLAFLFVLESLAPDERVAFLLREVFETEYSDIAQTLGCAEANARQLVSRARRHVHAHRPRFPVEPAQHEAVIQQFLGAVTAGNYEGLVQMLRQDAVTYSDGGGKASAAINPIYGADRVARFFLGIAAKAGSGDRWQIAPAGGAPALWLFIGDQLVTLVRFDLDSDGRIAQVFAHRNPDKLERLLSGASAAPQPPRVGLTHG